MPAHAATGEQAQEMVDRHLLNTDEFWGSGRPVHRPKMTLRSKMNYWRGRIWGPMNYLVYLGFENYGYRKFAMSLPKTLCSIP